MTKYVYTDGQGNTQKAISDVKGLVAQGVNAMVVFPDAGKAMLPALRQAHEAGVVTVPYRVDPGGKPGTDYDYFVSTDFKQAGELWGKWLVKALPKGGNVVNLGGPPANSQSLAEYQGMKAVLEDHPDIKFIGQTPYAVTNWDPGADAEGRDRGARQVPEDRRDHDRLRRGAGELVRGVRPGRPQDPGRSPPRTRTSSRARGSQRKAPTRLQALHGRLAELDVAHGGPVRRGQGDGRQGAVVDRGPAEGVRGLDHRQAAPGRVRQVALGDALPVQLSTGRQQADQGGCLANVDA